MADREQDPIEAATPEEGEDGVLRGSHSTAVDDVDTEARAEASDISNLSTPKADVDDATPAKLREHYRKEIRAGRVAPSRTGLETRLRRDLGEGASDKKITDLANEILGR